MLTALFRIVECLFPFRRFEGHPFALGFREGVFLDPGECEAATPIMQGSGHSAYQPVFQNSHTSDTAFIEVDPVLH